VSLTGFLEKGAGPVLLLVGDAPALVEDAYRRAREWAIEQCGPPEFNFSVYSAEGGGLKEALVGALTPPMMASKRIVVVTELESASDGGYASLQEYLAHPCESTVLLLTGGKLPTKRSKKGLSEDWSNVLTAAVSAMGGAFAFDASSVSPVRYAVDIAKSFGVVLGQREATELVGVVGTEHARIREEVRKLATYVGDGQVVTKADISNAVSMLATIDVWGLTSGVASRDAGSALVALHRLLEQGDAPHRLMAMVTWQLRAILSTLEALRLGASEQVAMRAGGVRANQFADVKARAGSWRHDELAATIEKLARTNLNMNSRRVGDRRELEALVIALCTR
jgi:DNA polymerase-3 subunit delta